MGFSTLLNPCWELIIFDPANELLPPENLLQLFFITEIFMVVGKFFIFEGKDSANFLKEGLLSSLLSSISLNKQQMLRGYLFLTIFNLFYSQLQFILLLLQSQTSIQGVNKHNCIIQTAKDHTPALLLIADVEPIDLNSSGARNTSSYFSPL